MSFQFLFNSITNICEIASKSLNYLSKANLNQLEQKLMKHGTANNPKTIKSITALLTRQMSSSTGLSPSVRRTKIQKLNQFTSKPIYGTFFPTIPLDWKNDHGRRLSYVEKQMAKERTDFELAVSPVIKFKSSAGIFTGKTSIGSKLWRNFDFERTNGQPIPFRSFTNIPEDSTKEELQRTLSPANFYGEQSLRLCRTHKSQLIKRLTNQGML